MLTGLNPLSDKPRLGFRVLAEQRDEVSKKTHKVVPEGPSSRHNRQIVTSQNISGYLHRSLIAADGELPGQSLTHTPVTSSSRSSLCAGFG